MSDAKAKVVEVFLPAESVADESAWRAAIAGRLGVEEDQVAGFRLVKRSLDARQRAIQVRLCFEAGVGSPLPEPESLSVSYPSATKSARCVLIVVGCGPAGMFAALRCLELGCRPIILERGKEVATLLRQGKVVEDSNYCFGEGGAGTFSDGKLYTRSKKNEGRQRPFIGRWQRTGRRREFWWTPALALAPTSSPKWSRLFGKAF